MSEGTSRKPLVVGLTGGIGSGKSAVANAFAAAGIDVTDTDVLAHALTAPGERGYDAVLAEFGPEFRQTDGTIDRAALRRRVFADSAARARLEAILHPLIRSAARHEVAAWTSPYGVLVVPLLLERGGLVRRRSSAGRRLPGRRAGPSRRGAQRPGRSRCARDHGDATVPRGSPRARGRHAGQHRTLVRDCRRRCRHSTCATGPGRGERESGWPPGDH